MRELSFKVLRGGARRIFFPVFAGVLVAVLAMVAVRRVRRPAPIRIAFANSLTGVAASAGTESLIGTRLYLDEVNRNGGIHGHRVELVVFDDASSAAAAVANAQKIGTSGCVAVLGHFLSTASLAASPGYKAARIPAVTGTAHVDDLTAGNAYYFRAQSPVSAQGRAVAGYIRQVWRAPAVELIAADDQFGVNYREGFVPGYRGAPVNIRVFHVAPEERRPSAEAAVRRAARDRRAKVIVIGASAEYIGEVLKMLRRSGLKTPVISTAAAGRQEFLEQFTGEPEERTHPGFFTENFYAAVPVIFDSTGSSAQSFAEAYTAASGRQPAWPAAGANGAARLLVEALRRSHLELTPRSVAADREQVRAALAGIDSPATGVDGIDGPLYFNDHRDMPRAIRMGVFRLGRFVTAPVQLVHVDHPEFVNLEEERRAGHIVVLSNQPYWLQRVVYSGIDINRLGRIDQRQGAFSVDFYLWMRYDGGDDAPVRVEFPQLLDKAAFNPERLLKSGKEEGLNYRLYRIVGDFKANYDLHDYPFDVQQPVIRFQNTAERRELVVYVIDRFGLNLNADTNDPRVLAPYRNLQTWRFQGLRYFVDSFAIQSTLGLPAYFATPVRTEYAAFHAAVVLRRQYRVFLVKTLLPLFLLVSVIFATMFFPPNLMKEQVTIPVTGILTSAVLLVSVGNQLPDIGYTVAIEHVFYIFFALCLMNMVSAFLQERWRAAGKVRRAVVLNQSGKIVYLMTVLGTVFGCWWLFLRSGGP